MLNSVIEALSDQLPFQGMARVLWIDEHAAVTTLITIEETPRQPWVATNEEVQTWLLRGEARRTQPRLPPDMLQVEEEIPEGEKALRDRNWGRIAGLVDTGVPG
jgi:putative transposase